MTQITGYVTARKLSQSRILSYQMWVTVRYKSWGFLKRFNQLITGRVTSQDLHFRVKQNHFLQPLSYEMREFSSVDFKILKISMPVFMILRPIQSEVARSIIKWVEFLCVHVSGFFFSYKKLSCHRFISSLSLNLRNAINTMTYDTNKKTCRKCLRKKVYEYQRI